MGEKDKTKVLCIGDPSVDHIIQLDSKASHYIDPGKGIWNLNPNTYFAFKDLKTRIAKLKVGQKWGLDDQILHISKKDTLTKDDTGFLETEEFDEKAFERMRSQTINAITGVHERTQPGGPLRNSLETAILLNDNVFPVRGFAFDVLLLGGMDEATVDYRNHLENLSQNFKGSSINPYYILSENWATHEAFNFIPSRETIEEVGRSFRTLIRFQEKRRHFDEELISRWFYDQNGKLLNRDAIFINSLKVASLMNQTKKLINNYGGRVIVAPTDAMYKEEPSATITMLERADEIVMNMEEAALITGKEYANDMGIEEKGEIMQELMRINKRNGRIYVTDDSKYAMLGLNGEAIYAMYPPKVEAQNNVNAGDTITGVVVAKELTDGHDPREVLRFAVSYTSTYVAMPRGTKGISKSTMDNIVPGWHNIPVEKIEGYAPPKIYHIKDELKR